MELPICYYCNSSKPSEFLTYINSRRLAVAREKPLFFFGEFQWRTQEFCLGGEGGESSTSSVEGRENGDLGAVVP